MGSADRQGDIWGRDARAWAELQERFSHPLWEKMLDATGVSTGTELLDAGCGSGGATVLAAARGAIVHGLDAAAGMIAVARERVPGGDFRVGDLEALPFTDASFDAVIAASSLQYADDPVAAVKELGRVARPGSRVAAGLFGTAEQVEYRVILAAVRGCLPDPPSGGGPFALSAPGTLEGLFVEAGLAVVDAGDVDGPFIYREMESFGIGTLSAGPVQVAIDAVGADAVRSAVLDAAEPHRQADGTVRFENTWRYVVGAVAN